MDLMVKIIGSIIYYLIIWPFQTLSYILEPNVSKMKANKDVVGLVMTLRHQRLELKSIAAQALVELQDPRAVEPLIAALKDRDKYVRGTAADVWEKSAINVP